MTYLLDGCDCLGEARPVETLTAAVVDGSMGSPVKCKSVSAVHLPFHVRRGSMDSAFRVIDRAARPQYAGSSCVLHTCTSAHTQAGATRGTLDNCAVGPVPHTPRVQVTVRANAPSLRELLHELEKAICVAFEQRLGEYLAPCNKTTLF